MKAHFENPPPSLSTETKVTGVNEDAQQDIIAVMSRQYYIPQLLFFSWTTVEMNNTETE